MKTIFGNVKINDKGYYQIKSRKEGNHNKYLHRLIFERFYGKIPKGFAVHHKDGNPSNNCILNLQLIKMNEHSVLHNKGKNMPNEQKLKISNSLNNTSTNYFRVQKKKRKDCKQGFYWEYQYYENGKRYFISSVNLEKLKEKVLNKGLLWIEFNKEDLSGRSV